MADTLLNAWKPAPDTKLKEISSGASTGWNPGTSAHEDDHAQTAQVAGYNNWLPRT